MSCSPWVSLGVGWRPVKVPPGCGGSGKSRPGQTGASSGGGLSPRHDGYTATAGYSETSRITDCTKRWDSQQHHGVTSNYSINSTSNLPSTLLCVFEAQLRRSASRRVPGFSCFLPRSYTQEHGLKTEQLLLPLLKHRLFHPFLPVLAGLQTNLPYFFSSPNAFI